MDKSKQDSINDGMLYTAFQHLRATVEGGVIVALTSPGSGEGVTHSMTALVNSLSNDGGTRILQVDSRRLSSVDCAPGEMVELCQQTEANLYEFTGAGAVTKPEGKGRSWKGDWEYRRDCMLALRTAFDYILIDCPALSSAGDALSLATLVDGIILVVQADKTRVEKIRHTEKTIEFARGKIIGHIFNKRTFNIPDWLYKRL